MFSIIRPTLQGPISVVNGVLKIPNASNTGLSILSKVGDLMSILTSKFDVLGSSGLYGYLSYCGFADLKTTRATHTDTLVVEPSTSLYIIKRYYGTSTAQSHGLLVNTGNLQDSIQRFYSINRVTLLQTLINTENIFEDEIKDINDSLSSVRPNDYRKFSLIGSGDYRDSINFNDYGSTIDFKKDLIELAIVGEKMDGTYFSYPMFISFTAGITQTDLFNINISDKILFISPKVQMKYYYIGSAFLHNIRNT